MELTVVSCLEKDPQRVVVFHIYVHLMEGMYIYGHLGILSAELSFQWEPRLVTNLGMIKLGLLQYICMHEHTYMVYKRLGGEQAN